jgi:hypothetical protein
MCLWVSYEEKIWENFLFCIPSLNRIRSWDPDPDLSVRAAGPRIRIRTKMSPIPNTGANIRKKCRVKTFNC